MKNKGGSAYIWWERSPKSGASGGFCIVNGGGSASVGAANTSYGVAFGFCV